MVEGALVSKDDVSNDPNRGERGRVLLVEDDGPLRQVCSHVLSEFGHTSAGASTTSSSRTSTCPASRGSTCCAR